MMLHLACPNDAKLCCCYNMSSMINGYDAPAAVS